MGVSRCVDQNVMFSENNVNVSLSSYTCLEQKFSLVPSILLLSSSASELAELIVLFG
jgi:hypothetical protein